MRLGDECNTLQRTCQAAPVDGDGVLEGVWDELGHVWVGAIHDAAVDGDAVTCVDNGLPFSDGDGADAILQQAHGAGW
jgi:hypothetical protein